MEKELDDKLLRQRVEKAIGEASDEFVVAWVLVAATMPKDTSGDNVIVICSDDERPTWAFRGLLMEADDNLTSED